MVLTPLLAMVRKDLRLFFTDRRAVIMSFAAILKQGQEAGVFRRVHPILAYESVIGPIIINAARERVAAQPIRRNADFPLLVAISHDEVIAHGQENARRMLAP